MLLLSDADVRSVLDLGDVIARVEDAFAAHGRGETLAPGLTHTDTRTGEFHVKTGGTPAVFGAKVNGAFRPAGIRGVIALLDARDGTPLAVMDSAAITAARTGAATAVAARHLARRDSAVLTIAGAGVQARAQLAALRLVLPIERVLVWSRSASGIDGAEVAGDLGRAARSSDVVVTCTPSRAPLLGPYDVTSGTFVAAVGADSPGKQELDPALLRSHRVVPDVLEQCTQVGELQHAPDADIHGELGRIAAGLVRGRTSDDEVFVFDSTGTALQDVAAGAAVYEAAVAKGIGTRFTFGRHA